MKERKKALLITYYWPPSGGAGVHRWLRFSRFFEENGVDLTVYCPSDAAWPAIDEKLNDQVAPNITVIRRPIFEPHRMLGSKNQPGVGLTEQKKRSLMKKLIVWVRGNLFIPDSRAFWVKPSVRFLSKFLSKHGDFDCIISTGPPHSVHLIAAELKHRFKVKWIADFRDPWTQIDFYEDLNIGKRADRIQHELEKMVLTSADEVVTVSEACAEGLASIAGRPVHVITNGYTFPEFEPIAFSENEPFTIGHYGSLPASRNPRYLWKALQELIKDNSDLAQSFRLQLYGTIDIQVRESIRECGLENYTTYHEPVAHETSIELQRRTAMLLLIANNSGNVKGILTGKFFEYLGAKRPILALGESGSDLENAMQLTNAGCFAGESGVGRISDYLLSSYRLHQEGNLRSNASNLEQFNSRNLAAKFCKLV